MRGCERGATVERSETGERTMFAPAGQTTARAGQLCWLAALVVRRQASGPGVSPRAGANGTLPRRGQDPSLRAIVHGCFVGSGLDRSAGWADISGLARRGGIHAAREPCAAAPPLPYALPANHLLHGGASGTPPPTAAFCLRSAQTPPFLLSIIFYLLSIYYLQHSWYDIPNPHLYTKRSDPF